MQKYKTAIADLTLLFVVFIWGTTFALMKDIIPGIPPLNFIFLRFVLATLLMTILYWQRIKKVKWDLFKLGVTLGLALAGGYFFQITGLQFTSASRAGFITGLSVVIVPIISTLYLKKLPPLAAILGVVMALLGLLFLFYDGDWAFNIGDLLVFFCAISLGIHIFLVGQFVKNRDPVILTIIQLGTVGILAGIIAGFQGELKIIYPIRIWWRIAYMAVMATGLAFLVQNWAQQFTSAIKTAIIFSMEPVFAFVFAIFWLGEPITLGSFVGGGFIIIGMIMAELGDYFKEKRRSGNNG